jgi:tetratricopeptide (TPR) repeat protein
MLRHYEDFELVIQNAGERYVIQLLGSPAGEGSGEFVLPFTHVELSNFYSRIGQVRRTTRRADAPDVDAAKRFGDQLFRSVFTGELLSQLRTSVDHTRERGQGLRIRLRLKGVPELAELPWEFLYDRDQDHFLATSTTTPMVRYLDLPQSVGPLRVKLPLRVLVVISGPSNLPTLDAEGEWERLKQTLGPLEAAGSLILERLPTASLDALRRRARGEPFHILHFIGHGGFDEVAGDGVLHFENPQGMNDPIPGQLLGNVLRDHDCLRLAVLNACEGARQSNKDPFSGVAQSLCQQRMPAIVAMQFEISDAAAKAFAEEFYGAIAEGFPVDASVSEARKALFGGRFGQEWATPVLYMRSPNGLLFEVQRRAKPVEHKPEARVAPQSPSEPVAQQEVRHEASAQPVAPRPPAPPPMPPPKPQPFMPSAQEEAERRRREEENRRREAENLKRERTLLEIEQARRRAAEEQRQRDEQMRAERQRLEEQRLKLERERLERDRAEEQRRQQDRELREIEARKAEEEHRQQEQQDRLRQRREAEEREERARAERIPHEDVETAHKKQPPPPPPAAKVAAFASTVPAAKPKHRVRNIILIVVGSIVMGFIALVIIGLVMKSVDSTSSQPKPVDARALLASGDQGFATGDYDKAISDYRSAISADDTLADAHSHLCNAIAVKGENSPGQKGDYEAAVSECERAVQLTPTSAEAHNNFCNALIDKESYTMALKGDFDRAIDECRQALKLRPVYAEAYNNLCNAIGTRSEQPVAHPADHDQAVAACRKAIELKPAYAEAHKNLGDLYRDTGDNALAQSNRVVAAQYLRKAAAEYRLAVQSKPTYARAQSALGSMLYKMADPQAIPELEKAVKMDPADYPAYLWLGYTYLYDRKDYDQALANFQKVMELRPDLAEGEYGLALTYRERGNMAEARQHLTRAHALKPDDKNISADYLSATQGGAADKFSDAMQETKKE